MKSLKVACLLAFSSIRKGNAGIILLTILILVMVGLNLLFVPGLLGGMISGANERVINTYAGEIIIESSEENGLIRNIENLSTRIENMSDVVAVTPRNRIGAELSFDNEKSDCIVNGIQPEQEQRVLTIHSSLIEGEFLNAGDRDKILLGAQIAGAGRQKLEFYSRSLKNVHAGDKITVTYVNGLEKKYTVKGIFYTEFIQTDLEALITEKEFQAVSMLGRDQASSLLVKLAPGANVDVIAREIGLIRNDIKVFTWQAYAGLVRSMTDSFNVISAILDTVNILIAAITVFIVTYIDVSTRRRQIGIQRAIGITPAAITTAYLIRALFYAFLAAVLATLVFTYIVIPIEVRHPFHFPLGDVYFTLTRADVIRTALILIGAALVAAFIPVQTVVRIKVLDAIWG